MDGYLGKTKAEGFQVTGQPSWQKSEQDSKQTKIQKHGAGEMDPRLRAMFLQKTQVQVSAPICRQYTHTFLKKIALRNKRRKCKAKEKLREEKRMISTPLWRPFKSTKEKRAIGWLLTSQTLSRAGPD